MVVLRLRAFRGECLTIGSPRFPQSVENLQLLYQIVVLSFVGRHVHPVTVVVLQRLRELAAYLEVLIRRIDRYYILW